MWCDRFLVTAAISSIFSGIADIIANFAGKLSTYILNPKLFNQSERVCVCVCEHNMEKNFLVLLSILLIIVSFNVIYL